MKHECVISRITGHLSFTRGILSTSFTLLMLVLAAGPAQGQTVLSETTWGGFGSDVANLLPNGRVASAATWGGTGFDEGTGVAVAADGTVMLAAIAQAPPYAIAAASKKISNVRGTLAIAAGTFVNASGTVANPNAW